MNVFVRIICLVSILLEFTFENPRTDSPPHSPVQQIPDIGTLILQTALEGSIFGCRGCREMWQLFRAFCRQPCVTISGEAHLNSAVSYGGGNVSTD